MKGMWHDVAATICHATDFDVVSKLKTSMERNITVRRQQKQDWFETWYIVLLPLSLAMNAVICYLVLAR